MANPLDPVLAAYLTTRDALRIANRAARRKPPNLIRDRHTRFYGVPIDEVVLNVEASEQELNRLVVLAMVAVFERTLRDTVAGRIKLRLSAESETERRIADQIARDIDFWKLSESLLNVFDGVDGSLRGNVKQLVDYRNWVAHGHTIALPPPVNALPEKAYERLTAFLQQAGILV